MLDLVPFARAGWQVAHRNPQACLVGQFLQLHFPQAHSGSIAAAGVGRDEQLTGVGIYAFPSRTTSGGSSRPRKRPYRDPCLRLPAVLVARS